MINLESDILESEKSAKPDAVKEESEQRKTGNTEPKPEDKKKKQQKEKLSFFDGLMKSISEWYKKTKEDREVSTWLKKAKAYENNKDYRKALDAYFNFIEAKLKIIGSRPCYTIQSYYNLIPYYIKIAELYQTIKHYTTDERVKDYTRSAEYFWKVATMYVEKGDFNIANRYFEASSMAYEEIGAYTKCAECHLKVTENYLEMENLLLAMQSYHKVAEYYKKAGKYEKAHHAYVKSAELGLKAGDPIAASSSYRQAGELLKTLGRHDEAQEFFFISADLGSEVEHYKDVADAYISLAKDYEETDRLSEAANFYLKAADTCLYNDDILASSSYYNAANCYQRVGNYKEAIYYYKKVANISIKTNSPLDAANAYWSMANCYEAINDLENAAESYLNYGKCTENIKGSETLHIRGYEKAAELYRRIADAEHDSGNDDRAIRYYKLAGDSYSKIGDYMMSGDLYLIAGKIELERGYDSLTETLTRSAEEYTKAGRLNFAAMSYILIRDYKSAAESYVEYARIRLDREDFFMAAEFHRFAGDNYKKLNQKQLLIENYNKAIQEYLKYIEKVEHREIAETDDRNAGNACFGIAEAYRGQDKLPDAEKYFRRALDYYQEKKMDRRIYLTRAFLAKTSGQIALNQGNYQRSSELLQSAIENFDKSINDGNWDEEYLKYLKENRDECNLLMSEIGEKPEVTLTLDKYTFSFVDAILPINLLIENRGNQAIQKVNFLPRISQEFSVAMSPQSMDKLDIDDSRATKVWLIPKKIGEFKIKPLEVLYEDIKGRKYVKSSNVVTVEVVEKPLIEPESCEKSIKIYEKYATTHIENKNYVQAGDGFKGIADCYRCLLSKNPEKSTDMEGYYRKSVDIYSKFIDLLKDKELSQDEIILLAEVNSKIGECYERIDELENAEKHLKESISHYKEAIDNVVRITEKAKIELTMNIINAFLYRVRAKISIKDKDYKNATQLLEKSIGIFNNSLEAVSVDKKYQQFLTDNLKET
ncbi:MAG TPA: tetratricopeptide repeat protein, partial [Candidatus Altiarchaeales archaeon]|nr:tetratricopeptide repeat protein [Candidatus Altiarchaeales archaeon]